MFVRKNDNIDKKTIYEWVSVCENVMRAYDYLCVYTYQTKQS